MEKDHPTEDDPINDGEEEKFEVEEDDSDFEDYIEYAQRLSADSLPLSASEWLSNVSKMYE